MGVSPVIKTPVRPNECYDRNIYFGTRYICAVPNL
jgi:hypothetical protein